MQNFRKFFWKSTPPRIVQNSPGIPTVVPVWWLNEKRNGKSHLKLEKTCKNEHSFGREKGAESGVYMHLISHAYI